MKEYTIREDLLVNATNAIGSLLSILQQISEDSDEGIMADYIKAFENVYQELNDIIEE